MTAMIEKFCDKIKSIDEYDYGDFMRSANTYLSDLGTECSNQSIGDLKYKLWEIQTYLQFNPSWKIETTRSQILFDAIYLDQLIAAHKQDWES